jgi:hypothetical protein
MSNLVHCDDCDALVDTELFDGEVVLCCGCVPDSYLKAEDCKPLDFNADPAREYEVDISFYEEITAMHQVIEEE